MGALGRAMKKMEKQRAAQRETNKGGKPADPSKTCPECAANIRHLTAEQKDAHLQRCGF